MSDEKELFPEGRVMARAVDFEMGETNAGDPQVAISFRVTEEGPHKGKFLGYYGGLNDKPFAEGKPSQAEFTLKALRACGWRGLDLSDKSGLQDNEVSLVIEHEEIQKGERAGQKVARVRYVNSGGGALLKKVLDPAAKKSVANKMKGVFAALEQSGAVPRSTQGQGRPMGATAASGSLGPNPPPHSDDDLPF